MLHNEGDVHVNMITFDVLLGLDFIRVTDNEATI